MKKECKECGVIKSRSEFYGVQGECKECTKKRIRISSRNIKKNCTVCKKEFGTCISEIKRGSGKFCSRKCWYRWNKEENVYNWKGDNAGYHAVHNWVSRVLGRPRYCEFCKDTGKRVYHWSNISGKYRREVVDWQRLCVSCHSKYDEKKRREFSIRCKVCNTEVVTKSKRRMFCTKRCSSKYYSITNNQASR